MNHSIIKNKNIQLFFRFLIFILILVGMHLIISGEKNGTISGLNPVFPAIDKGMIVFENRIDWTYANLVSYNYSSGNFHPFEGELVTRYRPDIDGDVVVWQEKQDLIWQIFMSNLSTGKIQPISLSLFRKTTPRVSGNYVVFVDERNGNEDIVLVNFSSGEEKMICQDPDVQ